ncbi:hypothetical protein Droror1_Dr00020231 [Drosera rotundifolia]
MTRSPAPSLRIRFSRLFANLVGNSSSVSQFRLDSSKINPTCVTQTPHTSSHSLRNNIITTNENTSSKPQVASRYPSIFIIKSNPSNQRISILPRLLLLAAPPYF